ncbi:hypothetical protein [Lysobacter sp. HA35]
MNLRRIASLLAFASLPALAQQAPPRDTAPLPDIEFAADVHMDSVRFASDPQTHVTFEGGPRLEHRDDVERDGLPTPVRAGTYNNVTVRTTISATLLDPAVDATTSASSPPPEDRP